MEETFYEMLERTRAVDRVLFWLAILAPLLVAGTAAVLRDKPVLLRHRERWVLAILTFPGLLMLWKIYNQVVDAFGLESVLGLFINIGIFAIATFLVVALNLALRAAFATLPQPEGSPAAAPVASEAPPEFKPYTPAFGFPVLQERPENRYEARIVPSPATAPAQPSPSAAVVQDLQQSLAEGKQAFDGAPDDAILRKPGPGKWSARDVLCHLIDTERLIFQHRIRRFLDEPAPRFFPDINHDSWEQEHAYADRDWRAGLAELEAERSRTLDLVRNLQPEQWKLEGEHEVAGPITLQGVAAYCARHTRVHVQQIRNALQAANEQREEDKS